MNTRIELTDNAMDALHKLSEGNPGAITAMMQMMSHAPVIDPDDFLGALSPLLSLDTHGIYGSRIWIFYKDVCDGSVNKAIGLMRCVQMGILAEADLIHAIDHRGDRVGHRIDELLAQLKTRLPRFQIKEPELEPQPA